MLSQQRARDAPIAAMAVGERDLLDEIAQVRVVAGRGMGPQMAIIAGARDAAEGAQALDVGVGFEKALRLVRGHLPDDFVEMGAPSFGLAASQSRKASRKKCRSACCCPTRRSSSPILAFARVNSSSGAAGARGRAEDEA